MRKIMELILTTEAIEKAVCRYVGVPYSSDGMSIRWMASDSHGTKEVILESKSLVAVIRQEMPMGEEDEEGDDETS